MSSRCDAVPLLILAQMSNNVYDLHENHKIKSNFDEIKSAGFGNEPDYQKQQSDYRLLKTFDPAYAVWTRDRGGCKQAVLAIKGTDAGSATDLAGDARHILLGIDPTSALTTLTDEVRKYKKRGYTVLVTGHSLGGYLGEMVSTKTNIPGCVFQAPGPDRPRKTKNGKYKNPNFHNVNARRDKIGNIMAGTLTHKQWSIYADFRGHSSTKMINFLKKRARRRITNVDVKDVVRSRTLGYYWY